jgi:hypothetical protein
MLILLWIAVSLIGLLILLGLMAFLIGGSIPADHVASATVSLKGRGG